MTGGRQPDRHAGHRRGNARHRSSGAMRCSWKPHWRTRRIACATRSRCAPTRSPSIRAIRRCCCCPRWLPPEPAARPSRPSCFVTLSRSIRARSTRATNWQRCCAGASRVTDKFADQLPAPGAYPPAAARARASSIAAGTPSTTRCRCSLPRTRARRIFAHDRGDLAFYYEQYLRLMSHWRALPPLAGQNCSSPSASTASLPRVIACDKAAACGSRQSA